MVIAMSKDRVEAFSDGVFSIILTLLVLELRVPNIADHSSLGQYAAAMAPLVPKLVSFVLTFVMIAIHWVSHHYFFRYLNDVTIGMVWLNNLLLLWICLLPFPTSMLGDHPTDQFPILVYGVNSLLCALNFLALRSYANAAKLLNEKHSRLLGPRRSIPAIVLFTLSLVLAFVNVYLSLACFLLVPLLYFVPTMIQRFNK
jgi:TMEM175 potassium channel family protein